MDKNEEFEQTVKELRESVKAADAVGAVDDILEEIMHGVGGYSADFSDMYSKYNEHGDGEQEDPYNGKLPVHAFPRRNYSAEAEEAMAAEKAADDRITRKMAPSVRDVFVRETQEAVRPEFSPDGRVNYPSFGVGESEERVVFDADWENQAKEEAARIDQFRRGVSMRPEPGYPRGTFQFTGADDPIVPVKRQKEPSAQQRGGTSFAQRPSPDTRYEDAYTPYLQEQDIRIGGKAQDRSFSRDAVNAAGQAPAEDTPAEEKEKRGLSPEEKLTVDAAVLSAFSSDFDSDLAFKERWRETVERAQKRKEQKAKEAKEEEARLRSVQILEEKQRKVARQEEAESRMPPPSQKGVLPDPETLKTVISAQLEQSETVYEPRAERLDTPVSQGYVSGAAPSENKVRKSKGEKASFRRKTRFSKEGFKRFMRQNFPAKGDPGKEIFRKIVMDVSFVALVCGLIYLGVYYYNYRSRIKDDLQLQQAYEEAASRYENVTGVELENAWDQLKAKYPDVDFPEGMNIKFAELYATNKDVIGWLSIENTKISTVVLQRKSNDDYYLTHDIHGKQSRYGNPFVKADCNISLNGTSKNIIIFGHNTHDKMIFNELENYMTVEGYKAAPIITLDTLYSEQPTKWKIFAVMLTNADPDDNKGYVFDYLYPSFSSESAFINKMDQILARSMIHTGVDVQPGDKTLMLYTCYRAQIDSGRLVIVARQVREGESLTINESLVYYNSSAIFPAAYYGKKTVPTTAAPSVNARPTQAAPVRDEPEETLREDTPADVPAEDTPDTPEPGGAGQDTPEEPPDEPAQEEHEPAQEPAQEPPGDGE